MTLNKMTFGKNDTLHNCVLHNNQNTKPSLKDTQHFAFCTYCRYAEFYFELYLYTECLYAECHYTQRHYAECYFAQCIYTECHHAKCHYAECHYAECRGIIKAAVCSNSLNCNGNVKIKRTAVFLSKHSQKLFTKFLRSFSRQGHIIR